MEGETGLTQSIIVEICSWYVQRDQIEGVGGVTRSIIDEIHSWARKEIKWKLKVVLLEV